MNTDGLCAEMRGEVTGHEKITRWRSCVLFNEHSESDCMIMECVGARRSENEGNEK